MEFNISLLSVSGGSLQHDGILHKKKFFFLRSGKKHQILLFE